MNDETEHAGEGTIRRIWLVPLLQAVAILVMAVTTWVTSDPRPTVLDTTVVACAHPGADDPAGTMTPCPPVSTPAP